ncbi:hypothetical protein H8356DRAFT_1419058 [Neocallimastix lanati (nom. inval.)]|nr:hypothetical protein H8356DRAFT_1419058 [Neocallimastix sp. JGI-2020a]
MFKILISTLDSYMPMLDRPSVHFKMKVYKALPIDFFKLLLLSVVNNISGFYEQWIKLYDNNLVDISNSPVHLNEHEEKIEKLMAVNHAQQHVIER